MNSDDNVIRLSERVRIQGTAIPGEPAAYLSAFQQWSDDIADLLDENMHGDNGELSEREIDELLVKAIHETTGHQYVTTGLIPVKRVAGLIMGVWKRKDYEASVNLCHDGALFGAPIECDNPDCSCHRLVEEEASRLTDSGEQAT
jgi:hypothetical protein